MENLLISHVFMSTDDDTHYHKPIIRRIYYNSGIVMVTNCSICKQELNRWTIEDNYGTQLNTSTSSIDVTSNIQV